MALKKLTGPCGLDCFNCPMYLAGKDETLRDRIAEDMKLPPQMAQCPGCRKSEGTIKFLGMAEPCKVYKCISEKELDFCCDCDDFPCDNLHPYADKASRMPHNTKVFNLCLIKKMGHEEWARKKAALVKRTYFKGTFEL